MARGAYQSGGAGGVAIGAYANSLLTAIGGSALHYGYAAIEAAGTWGAIPQYIPTEGWDPVAKTVIAGVLDAVGYGDYEQGVFDRTEPSVPVVFNPEILRVPAKVPYEDPDARPWPGDTTGPGWDPEEWVYPTEVEEVAIDWGGVLSGAIDIAQGQMIGGGVLGPVYDPQLGMAQGPVITASGGGVVIPPGGGGALCPPAGSCGGPRYLTYDCKTGQMSVRRRRRRRRLLTEGDKSDLGVIVAMFGKGAAAQIALAAAVKR